MNAACTHGGHWDRVVQALGLKDCPPLRLDFSVNLNPLGMPPAIETFLRAGKVEWERYPDPYADTAITPLAHAHSVLPEQVLLGNGSTELFSLALRVLKPRKAFWIDPCYCGYQEVCQALGIAGEALISTDEQTDFAPDLRALNIGQNDLLFLASPNNPTGGVLDTPSLLDAARRNSNAWFILDESYLDFPEEGVSVSAMGREMPANLIVVKSFTKFFALPGLRLGMICAQPPLTARLKSGLLPWSLNAAAIAVAPLLYRDLEFLKGSRRCMGDWRETLEDKLSGLGGLEVFPSSANFLYLKLPPPWPARLVQRELLQSGLLIRAYGEPHEPDGHYCRIAVRRPEENAELIQSLGMLLGIRKRSPGPGRRARGNPGPGAATGGNGFGT